LRHEVTALASPLKSRGRRDDPRAKRLIFFSSLNDADDIIIKHKHHEQNQDKHPDLLGDFPLFQADGFTCDPFNGEKNQMPAVQNRYGKEIQYPQVDAQQGGKEK